MQGTQKRNQDPNSPAFPECRSLQQMWGFRAGVKAVAYWNVGSTSLLMRQPGEDAGDGTPVLRAGTLVNHGHYSA